tara:strand:+ start:1679 stop:2323 length:645 start_codon:yes stop_codon:yes gene_type:complete
MTLAASGEMSLAGTATDRSVQVALGGDGTTQISMDDTAVRALAGEATGPVSMNDFHGKSAGPVSGITARYIRLTGFTRSVSAGPMITQFALYTDANLTNLIIGQEASTNPTIPQLSANVSTTSWTPNKAGSASISSGWYLGSRAANLIINDWIQYDMGSPVTIGSVLVRNGFSNASTNYWATGFNVEHSNDGTNWTLIQAVTNTTAPTVNTINT